MAEPFERYPTLGAHWRRRFGERVQRVSLDAGLSCPNRDGSLGTDGCAFCDPASFSPAAGDSRPVVEQLAAGIERLRERTSIRRFAGYFQPHSNTYAPLDRLQGLWDDVSRFPEVVALCVGTRPDCVPDTVLERLACYRERFEVWLELGLQSCHDETLRRLRRGHTATVFADACHRARARGLLVCAHVILGLPGEGPAEEEATADFLDAAGAEGVKVHHLAVVKGTSLAASWHHGDVSLLSEEEYGARAVAFLRRLSPATVLHRVCGDTRSDRLLAPSYNKGAVVGAILGRLRAG